MPQNNTATETKPVVATEPKAPSKAALARTIFTKNYGALARKDIIALFKSDAKLTENGAATYYQKFKKQADIAAEAAADATTPEDGGTETPEAVEPTGALETPEAVEPTGELETPEAVEPTGDDTQADTE